MKMTQKIGYALLLSFGIAVSAAADARLEMTADTTTYMYKCGTPANITLQGIDLPETAKTITCTVYVNGKKAEEKNIPANGKYTVKRTLDKPGWLAVVGTVKDANGKVLPKPKPLNAFDRQFKEGIGVLFEPEKIKAASECPADFEAFWNAQKEALKKVPMEVTKTEIKVPERFKDRTRCYDVKITCVGETPVSGYLSIPLNAKPKSMPFVLHLDGAGVRSAFLSAWRRNEIRFCINAHGIENGKNNAYYRNLEKTTLRAYRLKGEGNRETWYFKNMILRALRALEFAKTIPEWDGKNLIVAGESMGGGQAIATSALDPDVTLCQAGIPAWGDFNGPASGYPVPKKGEYNTYFDIANFAKLMKCPITLSAGLIDFTCSPYSIFCAYNALPKDTAKEIRIYPEYGHTSRCRTYPVDFLQFRKPFPKPSGKIISVPPSKKKVTTESLSRSFSFRDWSIKFDKRNRLEELRFRDRILKGASAYPALLLQPERRKFIPVENPVYAFDKEKGILTIKGTAGKLSVTERIIFDARGMKGLLEHGVSFQLTPGEKEPYPFYYVRFQQVLPRELLLQAPCALNGDRGNLWAVETIPDGGKIASRRTPRSGTGLKNGERFTTATYTMPLQADFQKGKGSLLFLQDPRQETCKQFVTGAGLSLLLQQEFDCCGWALPGKVHNIGSAYLYFSTENSEKTLLSGTVHRWYDAAGFRPAPNRPDWITDATIFEISPRSYSATKGLDLVRQNKLPKLAKLGFNTLWVMPATQGPAYSPIDYQRIDPGIGDFDDYRKMTDEAHKLGLKILQDVVPHGGTARLAKMRGNSMFALRFLEGGSVLKMDTMNALAFNSPEWQKYMNDCAAKFMEAGADGFRIDQCSGSNPDWRRTDYPDRTKVPKNADPEWWKASLKMDAANPPPHRASLSTSLGGQQIIGGIRATAKQYKKDAAVLAETPFAHYGISADMIYDFMSRVWLNKFLVTPRGKFVRALGRRCEEQYWTDPAWMLRMRYWELHDGPSMTNVIGRNASRAMTAILYFIHGVPLAGDSSMDIGNGKTLITLNAMRRDHIALRRGVPDYRALAPDQEGVFAVLRTAEKEQAAGIVNLTPEAVSVNVKLPAEKTFYDAESGEKVILPLRLEPWGFRLLTDVPPKKTVKEASAEKNTFSDGDLKLKTSSREYIVSGAGYQLKIDRRSGLPVSFANSGDSASVNCSLLLPIRTDKPKAKVLKDEEKDSVILRSEVTFPEFPGKIIRMKYICRKDEVRMDCSAQGFGTQELMLLFAMPEIERYQIDTADGRMDDFPEKADPLGRNGMLNYRHYENMRYYMGSATDRDMLYDSLKCPLNWANPEIRLFRGSKGIVLRQEDILRKPSAGMAVYRSILDRRYWHLGVFLSNPSPLVRGIPAEVSFTLRPIQLNNVPKEIDPSVQNESVRLASGGESLTFAGKNWNMKLARHGGGIDFLRNADGKDMIRNLRFESLKGYQRRIASDGDFSGGQILFQNEEGLHLRVHNDFRNCGRSTPLTGLSSIVEYIFPADGNTFFGSYQLIRNGAMPSKGGSAGVHALVNDGSVLHLAGDSREDGSAPKIEKGRFDLPVIEYGKPFTPYHWHGVLLSFDPAKTGKTASVPVSWKVLEPIEAKVPAIEDFSDFVVKGSLMSSDGKLVTALPWRVVPPPRIATWMLHFRGENDRSDNPAVLLQSDSAIRLSLQFPEGNGVFRFDLKHEGTETIRLNVQLFLTVNGKNRKLIFPVELPPEPKEWKTFRFPYTLKDGEKVTGAYARFRRLDAPQKRQPMLLDNITLFPEKK